MWKSIVAVVDFSHAPLAQRAVLMNIAEEADWPACSVTRSEQYFAEKLHISVRQFRRHIALLERIGELVCERRHGHYTRYVIPLLPGEADRNAEAKERREIYKRIEQERQERKAAPPVEQAPPIIMRPPPATDDADVAYELDCEIEAQENDDMGVPLSRQPQDTTAWARAREQLSRELPASQFASWIAPLHLRELRRFTHPHRPSGVKIGVGLVAPARDHARVVKERYASDIEAAFGEALDVPASDVMLYVHFTRKPQPEQNDQEANQP